jgi:hypothetical protein
MPLIERIEPVGSRVTCDPPPTDTDCDYLALLKCGEWWVDFRLAMEADGWDVGDDPEGSPYIDSDTHFRSIRKGSINLIVTDRIWFFDRFMAATAVAKRLNLLGKPDRIALFQAVLYGRIWHEGQILESERQAFPALPAIPLANNRALG